MNCHWNFGPGKMLLVSVQWLWKQINKGHAKFNDLYGTPERSKLTFLFRGGPV